MMQSAIVRNGKLYINGKHMEFPNKSRNIRVSQINGKVYVNGFEWTGNGWKRTLRAILAYLF